MFSKIKNWNYPLLGKAILVLIALLQTLTNIYLLTSQTLPNAVHLSQCLLLSSILALIAAIAALPDTFYCNFPKIFIVLGLLSLTSRVATIIMIVKINSQVSDQLYLTEEGHLGLLRTAVVFGFMQVAMFYEKWAFYPTKKEVQQQKIRRLVQI